MFTEMFLEMRCLLRVLRTFLHYLFGQISLPVVKDYDEEPTGKFKAQFSKIKKIGVKIIVTVLKKPTSFYVFSEALK